MFSRFPLWKTVAIAVATATVFIGALVLIVYVSVARGRIGQPSPTPTQVVATHAAPTPSPLPTTQQAVTPVPPDAVLGVVSEYTASALIIVVRPIEGNTEQIIVPENITVVWEDGRRASPREIARGQTIYAEGTLDSLGRLVAAAITIIDAGPAVTATPMVTPTPEVTPTAEIPRQAWLGEYFANMTLTGSPVLVRQDAELDFQWGTGSTDAAVPADRFSIRWRGRWQFEAGVYSVIAYTDDGVRIWVDGQLVVDNWVEQAAAIASGEIYLDTGEHMVEVEYFDGRQGAQIRVYWEKQSSFANWKGEYFANPRLEGEPSLVRNDQEVTFNWGVASPHQQIPADNFSVRWTREFAFQEGAYRFRARADDGVRVYVDDRMIIDAWRANPEQTLTGYVWLPQGTHTVRVEYLELAGHAAVQVWREDISSFLYWRGEYYANPDLANAPLFMRDDEHVDADWGDGSPGHGMPVDYFSVRWTRRLQLEAGRHNFWAYADDGVRVFVNGRLVIDAWQDSSAERYDGSIDLDAGEHRIVVEYYEKLGQAVIQFGWEKAAAPTATITPTQLPTVAATLEPATATPQPTTATPEPTPSITATATQ